MNVNRLTSVDLTAEIESKLQSVESGSTSRAEFMTTISEYVDEVIQQIRDFQYEELYQKFMIRKFKEILWSWM